MYNNININRNLANFKEGCHSEPLARPPQAERISGEEGDGFFVRCPVAKLIEARGRLKMAFLPNYYNTKMILQFQK